jgi:hypothetical protein
MDDREPRRTVARLLKQSQAHAGVAGAVAGLPWELAGRKVAGHPHSAWELVEHLRLAAEDLVSYCTIAEYRELEFPEGYWPATAAPPSEDSWRESIAGLEAAIARMAELVADPERDLYAPVPAAQKPDHHLLRAALILLDHDGYHAGQLIALRRALGVWPAA